MERRVVSHSAPYGHACMSCFKAKCRCIPRQDGDGCERCHRLKRQCAPSNSVRRRAADQRQEPDGRTGRVEGLVSMLQSRSSGEGERAEQQHGTHTSLEGFGGLDAAMDPFFATPNGTPHSATPEPSGSSPAACLDTFRSHMLPHFPFFHLPAQMTAQQLHLRRPFLFRAITCVASPTTRERRSRATELKQILHGMAFHQQHWNAMQSEQMENTMDLLLGLLTYIAWGWDHPLNSRLIMLAMSLVGEMRLDRPAPPDMDALGLLTSDMNWASTGYSHGPLTVEHGLEHQRSVLACFVISSAVSAYSGQVDTLRWTPQMERALAAISDTDSQHDHILAVQVRLQLLTAQALQIRDQGLDSGYVAAETLLIKLQKLHPAVQQHQGSLPAHFDHAELTIHEALHATTPAPVAVSACPPPSARPSNNNNTTDPTNPHNNPRNNIPPRNLTHLRHVLVAIQSCTTALLSPPTPAHFRGLAFPQWVQLTGCVAALYRFEAPDHPRWHADAVRGFVDLPVLLNAVTERLEGMAREAGEVGTGSISTEGGDVASGDSRVGGGDGEMTFIRLIAGLRALRERVLRGRAGVVGEPGVALGIDGNGGLGGGVAIGDAEGKAMVPAPQKGYFRNPRFWLDQIWEWH